MVPTLLHMLVDYPRLITETKMMVEMMVSRDNSLMQPQLAVWSISRRDTKISSFQRKYRDYA